MFSSWAQGIVAVYLVTVPPGVLVVRFVMIRSGARGFGPWREFWAKWGSDLAMKAALAALLYVGGFWN